MFKDLNLKSFNWILILIGLVQGAFTGLAIQDGLYNSQAILNNLNYDTDNLMRIWGVTNWSIWAQVGALLIKIGVNEFWQSITTSLLIPIGFSVTLGQLFLFFNKCYKMSLTLILFCFSTLYYADSIGYEVSLYSWSYLGSSLGQIGFLACLTTLVLFLTKHPKRYFLLALLPAIHIFQSIFIYLFVIYLLVIKEEILTKSNLKFFLYGALIALASFLMHLSIMNSIGLNPLENLALSAKDMTRFTLLWDDHRTEVLPLFSSAIVFNLLPIMLTLLCRKEIPKPIRQWLVFTSIFSIALIVIYITGLIKLSTPLQMAMPERLLNFGLLLNLPLVLICLRNEKSRVIIFTLLAIVTFLNLVKWLYIPWSILGIVLLISLVLIFKTHQSNTRRDGNYLLILYILNFGLNNLVNFNMTKRLARLQEDFTNDFPKDGSYLLAPSISGSKLQVTKKVSIFFDPTEMSDIPYSTTTLKSANEIMNAIYSVDLLFPNKSYLQMHRPPKINSEYVQEVWEKRDTKQWRELSKKFKFNYIVTPKNWLLKAQEEKTIKEFKIFKL